MNGITASKTTALIYSFTMIFGVIIGLIGFGGLISELVNNQQLSLESLIYGLGGFGYASYSFFVINSEACHVWIEDGVLKSKGQFFGCYKECRIADIKVVISYKHQRGRLLSYLYVIDGEYDYDNLKRSKYITLENSKENIEFIRTFWQGNIL